MDITIDTLQFALKQFIHAVEHEGVIHGRVVDAVNNAKELIKPVNDKIFHFHVQDPFGNKATLVCHLKDGNIRYVFYGGTTSSGTPYSLSNLQVKGGLPVESTNESKKKFKERIRKLINENSVYRVIKEVLPVKFKS